MLDRSVFKSIGFLSSIFTSMQACRLFGNYKLGNPKAIFSREFISHKISKIHISHTKVELDVIFTIVILKGKVKFVQFFRPFWGRTFSKGFSHVSKAMCMGSILSRILLLMSCINKPQTYILQVVECCIIK
jgi:hypothetical protein